MRPVRTAASRPTWRSSSRQKRPGPLPTCACRLMAASASPRSSTSSASSARRGSTPWRRSRPIWCCPTSPSTCSACPDLINQVILSMPLPLEGILVVSLEQAVAAPMCSCRLADAGARVIKIERPEGDFARGYDALAQGQSTYFVWLNRSKESLVLDLTKQEDKALLEAMLAKADVFIQNLKPGSVGKLGFAPARLRRDHPRLIVCSVSGYGESGPYAQRKAYDLLIQAEAGLAAITGGPDAPARVGVSVVDIAAGMNAYEAILEALIARGRTGHGAELSVSMFDAVADWMT